MQYHVLGAGQPLPRHISGVVPLLCFIRQDLFGSGPQDVLNIFTRDVPKGTELEHMMQEAQVRVSLLDGLSVHAPETNMWKPMHLFEDLLCAQRTVPNQSPSLAWPGTLEQQGSCSSC
jgi:hypothetical protein